jgi:isoaspartyl peptidase/L-asparaginase-like protein (Ntn-hydrolase superfamily)
LIIHGGAGNISLDHGVAKKSVMIAAIRDGYAWLEREDDAASAVETAIRAMEDSPAFNAGMTDKQRSDICMYL